MDPEEFPETANTYEFEISIRSKGDKLDTVKRLFGHLLVMLMPTEGMDETLSSLRDIYGYHLENLEYLLPEIEETQRGTGKVVNIAEAPTLFISE
jgi:hypothetical protein